MAKSSRRDYTCSFCGRSSDEVSIIPGGDGNICVDCVRFIHEKIVVEADKADKAAVPELGPVPTPRAQRDGMGREEGGGFRMGSVCIPVADSF